MSGSTAALVLSVFMAGPSYTVDVTPVPSTDDCHALRASVALIYARNEEFTKTSNPDIWETRRRVEVNNYSATVKLECVTVNPT